MAIPHLQSLEDCGSYAKTVEPYLDELRELPAALAGCIADALGGEGGPGLLLELYQETNPLVFGLALSLALGAVFLVVSELNRNYSQVDRCWSLLPTVYIAHFALWARLNDIPSQRLDAVLLFSAVWSVRLTYNYARKGGYNVGSEDYRWEVVKATIPAWLFHLFNLTFISFFQSVLLFLITAPAYTILLASRIEESLMPVDIAFVVAGLGLIMIEWVGDQQQWLYQTAKKQYHKTAKVPPGFTQAALDRGFLAEGLWAYSRHPNFAAEQSIWFVLYQWACFASASLYTWAGVGATVLVMLFQGSTWLTEKLTSGKYPEYKAYQKQVGMFVPTGFRPYRAPAPRVIRTSELAKRQMEKAAKATAVQHKKPASRRA